MPPPCAMFQLPAASVDDRRRRYDHGRRAPAAMLAPLFVLAMCLPAGPPPPPVPPQLLALAPAGLVVLNRLGVRHGTDSRRGRGRPGLRRTGERDGAAQHS